MFDPTKNIIAATPFCFPGYHPFIAYRYFPQLGIRNVEIPAVPFNLVASHELVSLPPELLQGENVKVLREFLAEKGLIPLTVAAMTDLLNPEEVKALRGCIEFAQQVGAAYVISDGTRELELEPEHWSKLVNTLRYVADYAADRSVQLALEIHQGPTRNGAEVLKLLEAVNHSNVGVNYDTGNIYYFNDGIDPADDIKHIAEKVIHIHLKDTTGGEGEWEFCALGEGRVNFPKIIEVLQSVGFRGPYSLEIEGKHGEDLNQEGQRRRMQKSLDYLRQIGLVPPG